MKVNVIGQRSRSARSKILVFSLIVSETIVQGPGHIGQGRRSRSKVVGINSSFQPSIRKDGSRSRSQGVKVKVT